MKVLAHINLKLIFVYFLATSSLLFGTKALSFLYDVELIEIFTNYGREEMKDMERVSKFIMFMGIMEYAGLTFGLLFSTIGTIRKKWHWLHALVVVVLAAAFNIFHLLGKNNIVLPKLHFLDTQFNYIIRGVFYIGIALFLFFNGRVGRYIGRSKLDEKIISPAS